MSNSFTPASVEEETLMRKPSDHKQEIGVSRCVLVATQRMWFCIILYCPWTLQDSSREPAGCAQSAM